MAGHLAVRSTWRGNQPYAVVGRSTGA